MMRTSNMKIGTKLENCMQFKKLPELYVQPGGRSFKSIKCNIESSNKPK